MNTNPKEVLEMRNKVPQRLLRHRGNPTRRRLDLICFDVFSPKIREQNLQDIKTAGPQSQVLCAGTVVERGFTQVSLSPRRVEAWGSRPSLRGRLPGQPAHVLPAVIQSDVVTL